ncbi:helix-turn-helix domain-containing protein [Paracoccus sp. p3-h83]|uniref:helix-turn-helix domain-containing protein n=1 Tax=Paracoccus sp. p3-h83 TaxID=3342805 RepID=UPI0035BA37F0
MTQRLPARIDDLPASLVDVAETLGLRVALSLIQNYGGTEVKFPVRPRPDHPVIKALGEVDALALCEFLGGQQIYVPHARPARSRRPEVLDLAERGLSRAEIARRLGLSQRYVRGIINRSDEDDGQLTLFGRN